MRAERKSLHAPQKNRTKIEKFQKFFSWLHNNARIATHLCALCYHGAEKAILTSQITWQIKTYEFLIRGDSSFQGRFFDFEVKQHTHFTSVYFLKLLTITRPKWEKLFTSKQVNAVTKSVLNSGKSSQMNTESIQLVHTMETLTSNLKELTYTIMKLLVVDLSQELSWWI